MSSVGSYRRPYHDEVEEDEGFTLIELLVVLLIIGILLAIAIPTFMSLTKGANNTTAQSNLQTALTGAKTFYTNNQTYSGIDSSGASSISQIDTGLKYVSDAGPSTSPSDIAIQTDGNDEAVILMTYSPGTQDCWGIVDMIAKDSSFSTVWAVPNTDSIGTYFFVVEDTTSSECYPHDLSNVVEQTGRFPTT